MFRTAIFFIILLGCPLLSAYGQHRSAEYLASELDTWLQHSPQEKVYLHTDRPFYLPGDTIWFKGYITIGSRHQLSAVSGALYVDFINADNRIIHSLKLPVTSGMTKGNLALPDTLGDGNYRLRAYTQWMRNFGADYFFDQTILISLPYGPFVNIPDGHQKKPLEIQLDSQTINKARPEQKKNPKANIPLPNLEIRFFPEGGSLVNGIVSTVAFHARNKKGIGIAANGSVFDNRNKLITTFTTGYAGIGTFTFKPESGTSYYAKVVDTEGAALRLPLPKAMEQGAVLSVYQPAKDSILVRINTSGQYYDLPGNKQTSLIAHTRGEVIYAMPLRLTSTVTSIWLNKKNFPSGIAQFALFNQQNNLVSERLAFINNKDQVYLTLPQANTNYTPGQKINLQVHAKDGKGAPVAGSFSVSVVRDDVVSVSEALESTLFSSMLLVSDLTGYIENPNYYFTNDSETAARALDNLMLTHNYRRFSWNELLNNPQKKLMYAAEPIANKITGRLLDLSKKPVPKGKVTLFMPQAGLTKDTMTDGSGRFTFDNILFVDSVEYTLQGRTQKNRKTVTVMVDTIPGQAVTPNGHPGYVMIKKSGTAQADTALNQTAGARELKRKIDLSKVQQLEEVRIRAMKQEQQSGMVSTFVLPPGLADQTFKFDNPDLCADLVTCLQGRLHGIQFGELKIKFNEPLSGGGIDNRISLDPPNKQPSSDGGEVGTINNYPYSRGKPMMVIVDGRTIERMELADIFDQNVLPASDIVRIEILRTEGLYQNRFGRPVLAIFTNRGQPRIKYDPSIIKLKTKGFDNAIEFHTPVYDTARGNSAKMDNRSTIYWNPDIKTAANGTATIEFVNPAQPGMYRITIEGINHKGEPTRTVLKYKVSDKNFQP